MITAPDDYLADAATWIAKALGINKLNFTLDIHIWEPGTANHGSGWIEYADAHADIYVTYDLSDRECIIDILAHEMVHLKQYLTGQLKDVPGMNLALWEGQVYPTSNDPTSSYYWDAPWEIEAFGRSGGLEYRYKAQREKKNVD